MIQKTKFNFGDVLRDQRGMYRLIMGVQQGYEGQEGRVGYTYIKTPGDFQKEIPLVWTGIPEMCAENTMIGKGFAVVGRASSMEFSGGGRIVRIKVDNPSAITKVVRAVKRKLGVSV